MKLVLLGAPGAGKSTQAQKLADHFGIAKVTTSEVLQAFITGAGSAFELREKVRDTMLSGGLVGDHIVIGLVAHRLREADCARGYVFDGFPRSIAQAEALEALEGDLDAAVYINAPDDVIIERISGRAVCPGCGRMYRVQQPPRTEGVCDDCGAVLAQRADDNPAAVAYRLRLYHEMTTPVVGFYRCRNKLIELDGVGGVDEIASGIIDRLSENGGTEHGHIG